MIRFTFAALLALTITAGCKDKGKEGTQEGVVAPAGKEGAPGSAAAPTETPTPTEAAQAEPAKAEYKPDELWKETSGKDRMALMEKFADGATVTGTIKDVKDDPAGEYVVTFDAGDGKTVEAMIADAQAARDKKLKAGDTVTVTKCQVANPTEASLPLRTCDLQ